MNDYPLNMYYTNRIFALKCVTITLRQKMSYIKIERLQLFTEIKKQYRHNVY